MEEGQGWWNQQYRRVKVYFFLATQVCIETCVLTNTGVSRAMCTEECSCLSSQVM